jgi:hypothetical protein
MGLRGPAAMRVYRVLYCCDIRVVSCRWGDSMRYNICAKCWENKFFNDSDEFIIYCVFYEAMGGIYLDRTYTFKHNAEARVKQLATKFGDDERPSAIRQCTRRAWIEEARGVIDITNREKWEKYHEPAE